MNSIFRKTRELNSIIIMVFGLFLAFCWNSCCDGGYSYHLLNIMVNATDNGFNSTSDTISRQNIGFRIRILHKKTHTTAFNPVPSANAECFPRHRLLDSIIRINVFKLNNDNSSTDVSGHFKGTLYYIDNSIYYYSLYEVASQLNDQYSWSEESFFLSPDTSLSLSGEMRFIVELKLSDFRSLRDTTQKLTLIP